MTERLQKVLAEAGVASRREAEAWIAAGRVSVNGLPAVLGQKVGPHDHIRVDGRPLRRTRPQRQEPLRVLLYRKRVGEVVTRDDPEGRRTVFRKLPPLANGRWIAVGRLDLNTSGLLLFTNHGELARRLMHPSFEVPREYAVRVLGTLTPEMRERLTTTGVALDGRPAHFDDLHLSEHEDGGGANQWYRVRLHEGRHREVRRLFESQGLQVSRLIRLSYGPIELGRGIRTAGFRDATPDEIAALLEAVGLQAETPTRSRSRVTASGDRKRPSRTPARAAPRRPRR